MTSIMLVDSTQGKRVFLMIQNQQNPTLLPGEAGIVGIAFDQIPESVAHCGIKLYPGDVLLLDKTVPQNRVYAISEQSVMCPIGVTVSNQAV